MSTTIKTILTWAVILGLGLGAIGQAEGAVEEKLINPEDIITPFEQGAEKVKVIVNLAEPQGVKSTTDWNSMQSLQRLHSEIRSLKFAVLSTLNTDEFKLRHRFENQAGFSGEVTLDGLAKLLNDPRVESIEPVYIVKKNLKQGIPLINASEPLRSTYNGQGVAIAIIDDGIDYTHPKLGGGGFPNAKVIGGYDVGNDDPDPFPIERDSEYHGTVLAGIAAGDPNAPGDDTGDYIGGVAYSAKLYALKVSEIDPITGGPVFYNDTVIDAIRWCIDHRDYDPSYPILVISISSGWLPYNEICDDKERASARAADEAVALGITILAASGNDGLCDSIYVPACVSNVISVGEVYDADVGSVTSFVEEESCVADLDWWTGKWICSDFSEPDMVPCWSDTASFLDILAPGAEAYTTDIVGSGGRSASFWSGDDDYVYFKGTSAACAYAAGAVASLQSAAKSITGNYLTPSEVREKLTSTGDNITDAKADITKPRVNLGRAIDCLANGDCNGNGCDTTTIGTGTSDWLYPMRTYYEDSRTQVIYLASEIGKSGPITELSLDVNDIPDQTMNNWTIRMKHSNLSEYGNCSLDANDWTVVYQNDEAVSNTGWVTFEFQTPFEYNGTDNLLVDFSINNDSWSGAGYCRYSTPGGTRSAYAFSDSLHGDPLNWSGTTFPIVMCSDKVPNVKLTICPTNGEVEITDVIVNPSFEDGMSGWTTNFARSTDLWSTHGTQSARIFTAGLSQTAGTWRGFSQDVDLTNITSIRFDATTTQSLGGGTWENCEPRVYIDDTNVWSIVGNRTNQTWEGVSIDTSTYTGIHTLSFRLWFTAIDDFDEDLHFDNVRTYLGEPLTCFPTTYSTYNDWVALGRPACWCAPPYGSGYQCDGDADGATNSRQDRVAFDDLRIIVNNWMKTIDDPTLDPCADIDHKGEGPENYRVSWNDVDILLTNWRMTDADLAGDCPRPE